MKRTHAFAGIAVAAAIALVAIGCTTEIKSYDDRKRALIYDPPPSYHPFSSSLLKELGYTRRWGVPLKGLVNVDVSSVEICMASDSSVVLTLRDEPFGAARTTHFLIRDALGNSPVVTMKSFPGSILAVEGKLYCVETDPKGFAVSSCDERLDQSDRKLLVLEKNKYTQMNIFGAGDTGVSHEWANTSGYFTAYPYIVFTSVNYSTEKYYRNSSYQGRMTINNSISFACLNLLSGEIARTVEVDVSPFYRAIAQKNLTEVLTPSADGFHVMDGGRAFVFSLEDAEGTCINGYFYAQEAKESEIYVGSAESIVKLFPSLSIVSYAKRADSLERLVVDQALRSGRPFALGGRDRFVLGYQEVPNEGFLVFAREERKPLSPCALYFLDPKLESVKWSRAFGRGIVVDRGTVIDSGERNVVLVDCDASGRGYMLVKSLDTGNEEKLCPVNLYQSATNARALGYAFFGEGLVLYDDEKGALEYFVQAK